MPNYGGFMQLHRRFTTEQVSRVLADFSRELLGEKAALRLLGVGHTQFFKLLRRWRKNPALFTITYTRVTPTQLSPTTEAVIHQALVADHELVTDPALPIHHYNYSAVRDDLVNQGVVVSLPTIIARAKTYGYYQPKRKKRGGDHTRQVVTTAPGALIQHDSSFHLWSPYSQSKWYLITSLDDYSRILAYARLVELETTWTHIVAAKTVTLTYGVPLEWYTDGLRIFRYVSKADSMWANQSVHTDEVNPQWKQCVLRTGASVIHALSAQAKGKIERPYQWLQDRVVRTCAKQHVDDIGEANHILDGEVARYNTRQIHSTTQAIPRQRFEQATQEGRSLFKPFQISKPYSHLDDIFCLIEERTTNPYRKISLWNVDIQIPLVPKSEQVTIHLAPHSEKHTIHVRIWYENTLVYRAHHPKTQFPRVHF